MPKTTTRQPLTLEDLQRALDDERHLGWGYAAGRDELTMQTLDEADKAVIHYANALGWNYEDLFAWANSKLGRWLNDELLGIPAVRPTVDLAYYLIETTVHRYIQNPGDNGRTKAAR